MSNKTTLQTNNNKLSTNNTYLASILNTINSLPEAGSGGSGGNQENITINFTLQSGSKEYSITVFAQKWENGQLVPSIKAQTQQTDTAALTVAKDSLVYVIAGSEASHGIDFYEIEDKLWDIANFYEDYGNYRTGRLVFSLSSSASLTFYAGDMIGGGTLTPW